ncbi:MAG: Uma2 family endonuclease [Salinibacter sp.]
MPATATPAQEHQKRWQELCRDPALQDLPYKIETNERGQIVLSPPKAAHSDLQGRILDKLREARPEGRGLPEFPITTSKGVRVPDVVWMPEGRLEEITETGDPPTRAPDVCIEVMSESNDWNEMHEKRVLYLEAGAEEVWVVDEDGAVRFFGEEKLEASELVTGFPEEL